MDSTIPLSCECDSQDCRLMIELPFSVAVEKDKQGWVIILQGCKTGPRQGDVLVKTEDRFGRYSFYQPKSCEQEVRHRLQENKIGVFEEFSGPLGIK